MNFLPVLVFLMGCTDATPGRLLTTEHFKIWYTDLDTANIREVGGSLEANFERIVTDLQSGQLPVVNVHLYADGASLREAVKSSVPDLPSWAIGLATSVSEIHMLSPNFPKQNYQTMVRNLIHEFAHCVSLNINKSIGNNPRWLWESVAIYEANLPWDPNLLPYLKNQHPPSLTELNQISNTNIYEVGYFIAEYIVASRGTAMLHALIKSNGDLKALGMKEEAFTKEWFQFVKKKYGI
jgi:hypothetical protein